MSYSATTYHLFFINPRASFYSEIDASLVFSLDSRSPLFAPVQTACLHLLSARQVQSLGESRVRANCASLPTVPSIDAKSSWRKTPDPTTRRTPLQALSRTPITSTTRYGGLRKIYPRHFLSCSSSSSPSTSSFLRLFPALNLQSCRIPILLLHQHQSLQSSPTLRQTTSPCLPPSRRKLPHHLPLQVEMCPDNVAASLLSSLMASR